MTPIHTMDNIQWNTLITDVAKHFDDGAIQRGLTYFQKGRVLQLATPVAQRIEAVVEGGESYRVEINLASFSASHCSCPVQGACKHKFAVLLEYARLQERPIDALVHARTAAASMLADNQAQLMELSARISSLDISQWQELFVLCTSLLDSRTRNAQYASNALASINRVKPPLPPALDQLFELHAHLFVLQKLVLVNHGQQQARSSSSPSQSFIGFHTHVAVSEVEEAIKLIFKRELALAAEPHLWKVAAETLAYLREQMLTEPSLQLLFWNAYDLLWRYWINPNVNDTAMYSEELQHLQSAGQNQGAALSRFPLLLAQSRMHFYLSNDKEAQQLLLNIATGYELTKTDVFYGLYKLQEDREWARLTDWLTAVAPLLTKLRRESLKDYSLFWDSAIQHLPGVEQHMWPVLIDLLPYTKKIYEEKLLMYGEWQKWIDCQLTNGSEPLDYRVTVFAPIEKNAPELLLPFYHQAVERYVLLKNRDNYKLAVKLLKRLAKLYKKMKKEASWELFITAFIDRHSRLRALLEELRKGNLIP